MLDKVNLYVQTSSVDTMIYSSHVRSTISITPMTRDLMKHTARKDQIYEDLIIELINERKGIVAK